LEADRFIHGDNDFLRDSVGKDFENFKWLTISGTKTETGTGAKLSGWTFNLYQGSSTTAYATATTDANGAYSFTVKDPGTYSINEVLPTGWTLTGPSPAAVRVPFCFWLRWRASSRSFPMIPATPA
jgi:hypothetical protein